MTPFYNIRNCDLAEWGERAKRGEIIILAMSPTTEGYRLDVKETPQLAKAKADPRIASLAKTVLKAPEIKPQEPQQAVKMVLCLDCGVEHEEGKECFICGPLIRAREGARANRRAYHLMKSGQRGEK